MFLQKLLGKLDNWLIYIFAFYCAMLFALDAYNTSITTHYLNLPDGDMLMRYLRILDLVQTGDWYNQIIHRDNYPLGNYIPWTRLFDMVILLPSYIIKHITDLSWQQSILLIGTWVSPVLYLVFIWQVIRLSFLLKFNDLQKLFLVIAVFLITNYNSFFMYGRGDHHGFMICLFMGSLLAYCHWLRAQQNRHFLAFAAFLVLGLWAGSEFLAIIFFYMFHMVWQYLFDNQIAAMAAVGRLATIICCCAIVLIPVDKPLTQFFLYEADRLSIFHVVLFGLVSLCVQVTLWFEQQPRQLKQRLYLGFSQTVFIGLVLLVLFPYFYLGPLAEFKKAPGTSFIWSVTEMKNIISQPLDLKLMNAILLFFGLGSYYYSYKKTHATIYSYLLLATIGFTILTCLALRWSAYYYILAILGYSMGIYQCFAYAFKTPQLKKKIAMLAMLVIALVISTCPTYIIKLCGLNKPINVFEKEAGKCNMALDYMLQHKSLNPYISFDNQVVMSSTDVAPKLLFWTKAKTIGSNYTRNFEGVSDTLKFYEGSDIKQLTEIIERRDINIIITCPYGKKLDHMPAISYLSKQKVPFKNWQKIIYQKPKNDKLFKKMSPKAWPKIYVRQ